MPNWVPSLFSRPYQWSSCYYCFLLIYLVIFHQTSSVLLLPEAWCTERHHSSWSLASTNHLNRETGFWFLNQTVSWRLWFFCIVFEMLWSPKLSLSNIHVRLTAKALLRNIQLLSGCRKNTVVFQAGLSVVLVLNIVVSVIMTFWAVSVLLYLSQSVCLSSRSVVSVYEIHF